MTHDIDYLTRTTSQSNSLGDRAVQTKPPRPTRARRLSDRQAVIAVMITRGVTCQDIALELMLPLRTVQGHLYQALRILNFSHVEDLTSEVVAAHHERNLLAGPSEQPKTSKSPDATGPADDDYPSHSLIALDAAKAPQSRDEELTHVAALTRELAATRAQLEQERDTVRHLHQAVGSRDTIGQAKGILMERYRISADAAFATLVGHSNDNHRKLVDVAHDLIYSGEESASGTRLERTRTLH